MTVAECRNEDSTRSKGARLAEAIIKDVTGVVVKVKLPQKKMDNRIGQLPDMKFSTAVDGTKVDLAKDEGKVVPIEGHMVRSRIAELPSVKKTYKKLNPKGFEIIGISLDTKESALKRFIKKENMPWPQFFDGKGWSNSLAKKHGIRSIPAMWLVDKQGNLVDLNARANLEQKVETAWRPYARGEVIYGAHRQNCMSMTLSRLIGLVVTAHIEPGTAKQIKAASRCAFATALHNWPNARFDL